jgi:glutathione S-transferase
MTHVLTYFAFPGRALVARICLGAAKVEYVNKTISFQELGPMKPSLPLGSVPILTLPNGRVVCQSGAINRYAASLANLYGSNAEERLLIEEVVCTAEELNNKCVDSNVTPCWTVRVVALFSGRRAIVEHRT